jgi:uncharacterized protein YoaH (UPF0181 family)
VKVIREHVEELMSAGILDPEEIALRVVAAAIRRGEVRRGEAARILVERLAREIEAEYVNPF